jgi:CheY-like chemotaxis protein
MSVKKRALVVDDSRLARITLSRLLEKYKLSVDTAESAEDALNYLSSNRPPHVIFMDHMMPGMDGLEAVQAIKKNPLTAMIPVVMYTSKEGDLYMGQARALGAVGVLPKPVSPVELEKIVLDLNLLHDQPEQPSPKATVPPSAPMTTRDMPPVSAATLADITHDATLTIEHDRLSLLRRLLEDHRARMREDLSAYSENIAEKVVDKLDHREISVPRWYSFAGPYGSIKLAGLLVTVASISVLTSWLIMRDSSFTPGSAISAVETSRNGNTPAMMSVSTASLTATQPDGETGTKPLEATNDQPASADASLKKTESIESLKTQLADQRRKLLEAIQWAINLDNRIAFDQIALGDEQLPLLNELIAQLTAIDFKGSIRLKVAAGDFCVIKTDAGESKLPPDDAPIQNCQTLNLSPEQRAIHNGRLSLSFARFMANAPFNNGKINIEILAHGRVKPLYDYPALYAIKTAGEWNKIARLNNRVIISVVPSAQ